MNLHFKIAANSLAQLISRIVSTFTLLLVTILITRNLSKEVWGDFVIITSYVGLFTVLADFGLNGVVLKILTREEHRLEEFFKNLMGLRLVLSLVAIFAVLCVLSFLPYSSGVKIGIIVGNVLIIAQAVLNTSLLIFQYKLRYDLGSISDILGSLVTLFLVLLAVKFHAGLLIILTIFIIGSIVKAFVSLFFVHFLVKVRGVAFNFKLWRILIISSLPLGLMMIFSQINASVDKQIIALTNPAFLGVSASLAVAIYGLSYRIFDFSLAIPTFVVNSAYPILLNSHKNDREELLTLAKQLAIGLLGLGLVLAVVGFFISPVVLQIFGSYSAALVSLRILLFGLPLFFVTSLLLWIIITINKEKIIPFIYGFAALANITLNLILIPKYGYNAAAWVTIISELIIFILLVIVLANYFAEYNKND